jgi:HK97 family phage major capsid protein
MNAMPTLVEKSNELDAKRGELAKMYKENQNADGSWKAISPAIQKEFNDRNEELGTLVSEVKTLEKIDADFKKNEAEIKAAMQSRMTVTNNFGGGGDGLNAQEALPGGGNILRALGYESKSLGEMFVDSSGYKGRKERSAQRFVVDFAGKSTGKILANNLPLAMKTLMTTSAGIAPYPPRLAEYVPYAYRQPVVADLMPNQDTNAPSIIYIEITTWTNNAAAVAEGGTKPSGALAGTQRTVPMTKIAELLPVTEEQMDDTEGIRDFIDGALTDQVKLEEDRELLGGSGSGSEMTGFYNKSGLNSLAFTGNRFISALNGMKSVKTVGYSQPTGWVMHPDDWFTFATQQDTTGRFILGNPGDDTPKRLWGLDVVETTGASAGTLLTGAFRQWAKVYRKMDLRIDAGWVNDDFAKNQMTIRAEERLALVIFRPSGFTKITGF